MFSLSILLVFFQKYSPRSTPGWMSSSMMFAFMFMNKKPIFFLRLSLPLGLIKFFSLTLNSQISLMRHTIWIYVIIIFITNIAKCGSTSVSFSFPLFNSGTQWRAYRGLDDTVPSSWLKVISWCMASSLQKRIRYYQTSL